MMSARNWGGNDTMTRSIPLAIMAWLVLASAASAEVLVTYVANGRSHFTIAVPDDWRIRTGHIELQGRHSRGDDLQSTFRSRYRMDPCEPRLVPLGQGPIFRVDEHPAPIAHQPDCVHIDLVRRKGRGRLQRI